MICVKYLVQSLVNINVLALTVLLLILTQSFTGDSDAWPGLGTKLMNLKLPSLSGI